MVDKFDDEPDGRHKNLLKPLNIKEKPELSVAVAIRDSIPGSTSGNPEASNLPQITAAGRGKIAEQILQLAFENGIKVRQDSALAEMLATLELDSPVPNEALVAVAEILSYVYRANGEPNPFDAPFDSVLANVMNKNEQDQES